jgi:hypothetical protein
MTETGYGAFISYRHIDVDRKWARWLHRNLEAYRTPPALARVGIAKRIGRVFRDEEELAASPQLSESIERALDKSEFLIVVCSPRTPDSRWVEQEILRFQTSGKQKRILTLLIEGEPGQSFPPVLRQAEPLAADVRPVPGESARQLRENAKLKLLATILGCNFDDLRRRELQRQRKRWMKIGVLATFLLILVSSLAIVAMTQRNLAVAQARLARAQALAANAQLSMLTGAGDSTEPERAILLALESIELAPTLEADGALRNALQKLPGGALPSWVPETETDSTEPPPILTAVVSPDAKLRALPPENPQDPVIIEETKTGRKWNLPHEWTLQAMRFSPDGRWLVTVTAPVSIDPMDPSATVLVGNTIRVWETDSAKERTRISLALQGGIYRTHFSPDGNALATFGRDGAPRLWILWPDQLRASACSRLTRNLSPSEWSTFMGTEPRRDTCPGKPVVSE